MYCPNCRYEYKPGITACPDCGAALVARLEPVTSGTGHADESAGMVTVFESYTMPEILIAKSILEEAGIRFFARDRSSFGVTLDGQPSIIMVDANDAERAHEFLANLAMDRMLDVQMDRVTFDDEIETGDEEER